MTNGPDTATGGAVESSRELTAPVDLCTPAGHLNPAAVGWSRHPLHRCNLRGAPGRKKRWEYWCVTSEDCFLAVTYADVDYLGLATVLFRDRRAGRFVEKGIFIPGALGFRFPETVGGASVGFRVPGLTLKLLAEPDGMHLVVRFRNLSGHRLQADVLVRRPPGHETLNVVVPWSDERFQFTSKQNTLPAEGEIVLDGERFALGPHNQSFGCLDFGRGIWPADTTWNWGFASGVQQDRTVGLQFGAQWTDGTGQTENGLMVDGRLSKIHEDVRFDFDHSDPLAPWRIATVGTDRIALDFVPECIKPLRVNLLIGHAHADVCFGHYTGTIVPDDGPAVHLRNLFGSAEEMRARW